MEVLLSKEGRKGKIMWYMELWDNGKQVTTWMPGKA
jgi:hypothetical protein